jgi:hypothetical protein
MRGNQADTIKDFGMLLEKFRVRFKKAGYVERIQAHRAPLNRLRQ